jgi:putative endonuclease
MYYIYLLKSIQNNQVYIGFTGDLKQRFKDHNSGFVKSTKPFRPWKLIYYEAYLNEKDARERERQLKYFGKAYGQLKNRIKNCLFVHES